jgi:hypothetical protein
LGFKAAGGVKLTAIIAKLKNEWSHTSTPAVRFHNVDGENVTVFSGENKKHGLLLMLDRLQQTVSLLYEE